MKCPKCEQPTITYDSREKDGRRWRRRKCSNGHRFKTWEVAESEVDAALEADATALVLAAMADIEPLISACIKVEINKRRKDE